MFVHDHIKKILLAVLVIAVVLAVVFYFGSRDRQDADIDVDVDIVDEVLDTYVPDEVPALEIEEEEYEEEEIVVVDPEGDTVKQIVRVFVEQWGSHTATDFSTIDNAKMYASQELGFGLDGMKQALENSSDPVMHIVTEVLGLKITERTDIDMIVEASAHRVERANGNLKKYNQRAVVELIQVEGVWLVNRSVWGDSTF